MKTITFHLMGSGLLIKNVSEEGLKDLLKTIELGFKSRKLKNIISGEDFSGNPFYVRLESVHAIDVSDFNLDNF